MVITVDPSNHPATLILQRSGQDKVLNVQPTHRGAAGVGIQLQPPAASAPTPPARPAPPAVRPLPPAVNRLQGRPSEATRAPPQLPPPPRVDEEELLGTMAEIANPIKKSDKPRLNEAPAFDDDDFDDDGGGSEMEDEGSQDGEGSEPGSEGGSDGYGAEGGQDEFDYPAGHAGAQQLPREEPYAEKPGEGYRSVEEEKSDIMFKLQRLQRQGVRGLRTFTPYSDIRDMRAELTRIRTELELERSIKMQRKILMAIISALEWGNGKFNPFDLELDGWSEQMHQSVQTNTEYDGIFEELYFKYRGKVSTPPEVRLLLMVGGSAMMFHMTKSMVKNALPNLGDMMRQNPDMMQNMMRGLAGGGGGGAPQQQQSQPPPSAAGDGGRREMRGPGFDVGGLMGGGLGGGLGGLMGGGGGGLGGGLGGLMGGLGGGLGGLMGGGLPGMGGVSGAALPSLAGVPPPPSEQIKPQPTRPDRAAPQRLPRDMEDDGSDRLSDVLSDDLQSVPDDLQSVRSDASGSSAGVKRISVSGAGRRAKKAKTTGGSGGKKVITI